jgi:long-chain fatty acid transport protein
VIQRIKKSQSAVFAAALAAGLLPLSAQATNGYFTHGVGARTQAVAGVSTALPQDAMVIASNPAGISALGNRLDLGVSLFRPVRGAVIEGNFAGANGRYDGNDTELFVIPELAYVRELSSELTAGIAIYGNGGMNTDYGTNPFAAFGSTGSAGVNLEQLFVTPALSWKLSEQHSVGVAATFAWQRFEMKGIGAFDNPFFTSAPGRVTNNGDSWGKGAGVKLGWTGQLTPTLTLGASWASRINMDRFERYAGLYAEQGGFDIPATYALGAAWKSSERLTLAADWQHIEYGSIKSIANPLSNLLSGNALGTRYGGGFGWRDIDVIKLGAIYQYSEQLTLRAGVSRADQPVPASETFFNILAPGTIRDHVSAGASWKTTGGSEWSLSYTHALKEWIKGQQSIPMPFGGGNANVHLKEDILTATWTLPL